MDQHNPSHPVSKNQWPYRRLAIVIWMVGVASLLLPLAQARWYVFHPHYLPLCALLILLTVLTLVVLVQCTRLIGENRSRFRALAILAISLVPLGTWGFIGWYANQQFSKRIIPNNPPMRIAKVMGATFMHAQLAWGYPNRQESSRLVMFSHGLTDPQADLEAMDRHIAHLEEILGGAVGEKIYWCRGSLLGQSFVSFHGFALGSSDSDFPGETYRGDRHELAHAVLDWFRTVDSDPPYLLHEGWGMAMCGDDSRALAVEADLTRIEDPQLTIPKLLGREWYYRGCGPVYSVGGAFVDFLIRTRGGKKFRQFYVECQFGRAHETCEEIYGIDLAALDEEFWADVEQQLGE